MSDKARQLREYLVGRGGHTEAPITQLVGPWDPASRETYAARVTAELDGEGIICEPPLAECGPDAIITLRLRDVGAPTPAQTDHAAAPEPTQTRNEPPDDSPISVSERRRAAPRVPRLPSARSIPRRAAAASLAALLICAIAVAVASSGSGSDSGSSQRPPRNERSKFCDSAAGQAVGDAEFAALEHPRDLNRATRSALRNAESAPPGADCAVLALDTIAGAWAKSPDQARAHKQIRRIRAFQSRSGLLRPEP